MTREWKSWCRLCAKENGSEIDVFIKNENTTTIADAIQNYFSVSIFGTDIIPKKICNMCYDIVIGLVNFSIRSSKVQQLFSELQFQQNITSEDTKELRIKYGLTNQNYDLKCLKDTQNSVEQEDIININDVPHGSFLDENIDGIFKYDNNSNFSAEMGGESSNISSEDEKPILKLKIKKDSLKRHRLRRKNDIEKDIQNEQRDDKIQTNSLSPSIKRRRRNDYPIVCGICSKSFNNKGKYYYHKKTQHVDEQPFICEECGKVFVTSYQLNSHKVVHSGSTPFQCPKCPKSFKRLISLKNHVDSHEDTKYVCPICECQLNTKTILRRHMVIHSDEKKYKCNFCQKQFKRTKDLKNHLILHTGLKPYQCPFCDQTFASGSNCRKHQKHSHPIELDAMERSGEKMICKNVPSLEHLKAVNNAAIMPKK